MREVRFRESDFRNLCYIFGNVRSPSINKKGVLKMIDVGLVLVIITIVGGALAYIRKEKKRGVRCVGCPHSRNCGGKCNGVEHQIKK